MVKMRDADLASVTGSPTGPLPVVPQEVSSLPREVVQADQARINQFLQPYTASLSQSLAEQIKDLMQRALAAAKDGDFVGVDQSIAQLSELQLHSDVQSQLGDDFDNFQTDFISWSWDHIQLPLQGVVETAIGTLGQLREQEPSAALGLANAINNTLSSTPVGEAPFEMSEDSRALLSSILIEGLAAEISELVAAGEVYQADLQVKRIANSRGPFIEAGAEAQLQDAYNAALVPVFDSFISAIQAGEPTNAQDFDSTQFDEAGRLAYGLAFGVLSGDQKTALRAAFVNFIGASEPYFEELLVDGEFSQVFGLRDDAIELQYHGVFSKEDVEQIQSEIVSLISTNIDGILARSVQRVTALPATWEVLSENQRTEAIELRFILDAVTGGDGLSVGTPSQEGIDNFSEFKKKIEQLVPQG